MIQDFRKVDTNSDNLKPINLVITQHTGKIQEKDTLRDFTFLTNYATEIFHLRVKGYNDPMVFTFREYENFDGNILDFIQHKFYEKIDFVDNDKASKIFAGNENHYELNPEPEQLTLFE